MPDPARSDLRAAVQDVDNKAVLEHGLTVGSQHCWIRVHEDLRPITPETHGVLWDGKQYTVKHVSALPNMPTELIVEYTP